MLNSIINADLEFLPFMKYFCTKSCVLQLLQYHGISEAILYIKVGFFLDIIFTNSGFWVNSKDALAPSAVNNFISQGYSDSYEEIYELNKRQLLSGSTPIVLVDTFYLPYRKEYLRTHASHSVIFAGYNEQSVYLIDYYPPHYFKGFVDKKLFKKSRTSTNPKDVNPFSGIEIKNYWYDINLDEIRNYQQDCIISNLSDTIKKTFSSRKNLRREDALIYLYTYYLKNMNANINDKKRIMRKLHDSLYVYQNASNLMIYYLRILGKRFQISEEIMISLQMLNESLMQFNVLCMRGSLSQNTLFYDGIDKVFRELIERQAICLKNMDNWFLGSNLLIKL